MRRVVSRFVAVAFALAVAWAGTSSAHGQSNLPLGLRFGMSQDQARTHLVAAAAYATKTNRSNELAYVVPEPSTNTRNGLFLKFENSALVEIASAKSEMDEVLYRSYLSRIRSEAERWVNQGAQVVFEDNLNSFYVYHDAHSFITISGAFRQQPNGKSMVTITFTESRYHEARERKTKAR
jgi:hypothetical protein